MYWLWNVMCTDMFQPWTWLQGGDSAVDAHCRPGTKLLQVLRIHWVTLALSFSICLGNRIQDSYVYPQSTRKWARNKIDPNLWSKHSPPHSHILQKGFQSGYQEAPLSHHRKTPQGCLLSPSHFVPTGLRARAVSADGKISQNIREKISGPCTKIVKWYEKKKKKDWRKLCPIPGQRQPL